jgi:hypothetical protein
MIVYSTEVLRLFFEIQSTGDIGARVSRPHVLAVLTVSPAFLQIIVPTKNFSFGFKLGLYFFQDKLQSRTASI